MVSESLTVVFRTQDRAILHFDLKNKTSGSDTAFMIIQADDSASGDQTDGNDVIVGGHDVSAEIKPSYHECDLANTTLKVKLIGTTLWCMLTGITGIATYPTVANAILSSIQMLDTKRDIKDWM